MAEVSIYLLGPPEIRWKDKLLRIRRRIPRALLFYLASQNSLVGREKLLNLFWENTPESLSRKHLRETLSRLRSELPHPDIIISYQDLIGLDLPQVDIDLWKFQDLIDQNGDRPWQITADQPLPEEIYQRILSAVNLWRGPTFLDGADLPSSPNFDDWLTNLSNHLAHLRGRLLERLTDHARAVGELEKALGFVGLALENDKLNEDLHYRYLRLLVEMGRYNEARKYFSYLHDLLQRELNQSPDVKFNKLLIQIQGSPRSHQQPSQPEWRIWPTVRTPLVGRRQVLEQIIQKLATGGGILLLGESGLGKSRLVQELCKHLDTDWRILLANCRTSESSLPFQPIIEMFRSSVYPEDWLSLPPVWASRLTHLLPELSTIRPSMELPSLFEEPTRARASLLESIRQVCLHLSQDNNLFIFLDDGQWADESTLTTISYLIQRPPFDRKATLVLAARLEEISPSQENLIVTLQSFPRFRTIRLAQLNQDEISVLGRYVLGYPLPPKLLNQLDIETGGNPLFILETLQAFLDQRVSNSEFGEFRLPLTDSIYSLIRSRLTKLSPMAREVINAAAAIGTEFDPDILSLASHQNPLSVARALAELRQRHLVDVISRSPQEIRYRFIHEKFRETLLLETDPVHLRILHGNIARALEARFGTETSRHAAVIAQHYELAGELNNAFINWIQAGQHARLLFSIPEATEIFTHAEGLIQHAGNQLSDEVIHQLYSNWTDLAFEEDDTVVIQHQNTNLLHLGRQRQSSLLIGAALDGLSDASMTKNRFAEGLGYANQAITFLERTDNKVEQMDAYIHRGVFLYMLNNLDESHEALQKALTLAVDSRGPQIQQHRASAHYHIALIRTLSGWPEIGRDHALRSLEEASALGHHHTQSAAYTALAFSRYFLGEYDIARIDNQRGIEIAEKLYIHRMLGYLHAIRGMIELCACDIGASIKHAEKAINLGNQYQHDELIAMGYRILGDVDMLLGNPQEAESHYQLGLQASEQSFWAIDIRYRLGLAHVELKQIESGLSHLNQSIGLSQSSGLGMGYILGKTGLGLAYLYSQDWSRAREIAFSLLEPSSQRSLYCIKAILLFVLGEADMNTGELESAVNYLQSASQLAARIGNAAVEIFTLPSLIRALHQLGQPTHPSELRMSTIFDKLEKTAPQDELRQSIQHFRQQVVSRL